MERRVDQVSELDLYLAETFRLRTLGVFALCLQVENFRILPQWRPIGFDGGIRKIFAKYLTKFPK